MNLGTSLALPFAAALTDSGLLLIVVAGGVVILAFLLFVLREALSHPVDGPRELPPARELSPPHAAAQPTGGKVRGTAAAATGDLPDPAAASGEFPSEPRAAP